MLQHKEIFQQYMQLREKEFCINSDTAAIFNIFRRILLIIPDQEFNEEINLLINDRDIDGAGSKVFAFHIALRQRNILNNSNLEMLLWNTLQLDQNSKLLLSYFESFLLAFDKISKKKTIKEMAEEILWTCG